MNLQAAQNLTISLMEKHNLEGWKFQYHNKKRTLGTCVHGRNLIQLSKSWTLIHTEEEVLDTILHEIAHALVGYQHDHDFVWQAKAIEIGANPSRHYQGENNLEGKYVAICPKCGSKHYSFKLKKRESSCGYCSRKFDRSFILNYMLNTSTNAAKPIEREYRSTDVETSFHNFIETECSLSKRYIYQNFINKYGDTIKKTMKAGSITFTAPNGSSITYFHYTTRAPYFYTKNAF